MCHVLRLFFLHFYMPTQDVALKAVTMAVATDALHNPLNGHLLRHNRREMCR